MKQLFLGLAFAAGMLVGSSALAQTQKVGKPSIVLVHGAFADASSWNGVIPILRKDGYVVIAAANPLRGVKSDATYVSSLLGDLKGSVVLVGHSYGGNVITEAANGHDNVKALVYVSAFAPDTGESASDLAGKFRAARSARPWHRPSHSPTAARISTSCRTGFVHSLLPTFPQRRPR